MRKTENLRNILAEVARVRQFEPKMLEQKVFELWRKHFGAPLGTKTTPVSVSDGVLKIYTEYPSHKVELLLNKQKIITNLNAELEQPILTDLRVELRPVQTASSEHKEEKQSNRHREASKELPPQTDHRITPEELERIEQILANVTDAKLKKSLRQLFITQNEDKP